MPEDTRPPDQAANPATPVDLNAIELSFAMCSLEMASPHAVDDVAALIAEVRRLREQVEDVNIDYATHMLAEYRSTATLITQALAGELDDLDHDDVPAPVEGILQLRADNARLNHDANTQYATARHLAEMDADAKAAAEDLAAARAAQSEALGAVADLAITLKLVRDRIGGRIDRFVDAHGGLVPGVTANLIDGILSDLDGAK